MGKINLLVANASGAFTDEDIGIFESAAKAAEEYADKSLGFDYEVDFVVTAPSLLEKTIPEDGISGKTYSSRLIVLVINKEESKITEDKVFETICHELSHSLRWEKLSEYADTLFKNLIMEGLAIALETKAMKDTNRDNLQYFLKEMHLVTEDEIRAIEKELESTYDQSNYNYYEIFFSGSDKLPRWAGYKLGYYLVKNNLETTKRDIAEANIASYSSFKN